MFGKIHLWGGRKEKKFITFLLASDDRGIKVSVGTCSPTFEPWM